MATQLSVDQILRLNQHEIVEFVQQNITHEDGTWNVSNILDWEDLPQDKMDLLATKLLPAVEKATAPTVDAADLAALLARIPSDRGSPIRQTTDYPSPSRSSTVEPPENAEHDYETKCYQALLEDGCRPLFHIRQLMQVSADADAYHDLLRPWTRYPGSSDPEDWLVFSRQLRRWKEFRKWQLRNRRQTVTFSEFLKDQQREFERMGAKARWIAGPDFEQAVRVQWENEYGHAHQQSGNGDDVEATLSKYSEAAKRLLTDYGFVQSFELQSDPKQQDQWTTYVEYLAFECFWLDRFTRTDQKLRVKHDTGWDGLVKAGLVKPIDTLGGLTSTEVEDMRERELERIARAGRLVTAATCTPAIDMAKETCTQTSLQSPPGRFDGITPRNDLVKAYVHNKQKYQSGKAELDHQKCRVEWVQSEISKIAAESTTTDKNSSSLGSRCRKRKSTDDDTDDGDVESRVAKHMRTAETEDMVAAESGSPRRTRSKKRKLPMDEDTQTPQSKTETMVADDDPGTINRKRGKEIHAHHGSEDSSRVLEPIPETTVVSVPVSSTVASNSQPPRQAKRISRRIAAVGSRDEILKTLRPRVGGKVAVVRRLEAPACETARKDRRRPRST